MPIDEFIINIYLMVEQYYKIVVTKPLRSAGYAPKLSDPEIICMEMVGEFLHLDQDKQIWQYFTQHSQDVYQPSAHTLTSQSTAPICGKSHRIQDKVSQIEGRDNIHFMDGFPIPVCHYGRAYRHKNYQDLAAFSYCAAKQERYYGFEGHLLVNLSGMIKGFTVAPANVDERAVAPDITDHIHGLLGADKGYISPSLTSYYDAQGVDLQTPLRANMKEDRPKPVVRRLMKARRIVETVIGQLSERFNIQKVRARDLWHLSHRLIRKILSHNLCFVLNKKLGNPPLQFDLLISS